MSFPEVTAKDWRAQVDKELAGTPFEKALVHRTAEGLSIQPLYTEGPAGAGIDVDAHLSPFRICLKVDPAASAETVSEELEGGADALWLDAASADVALAAPGIGRVFLVLDCAGVSPEPQLDRLSARLSPDAAFALGADPFADVARGLLAPAGLAGAMGALVRAARAAEEKWTRATVVTVSTLPYHDAGADAADELGIALATGAAYLEALIGGGLSLAAAARQITFRLAAGRDTFGEMCKLRALRVVWRKVLLAAGAIGAPRPLVHAVCSSRTLARSADALGEHAARDDAGLRRYVLGGLPDLGVRRPLPPSMRGRWRRPRPSGGARRAEHGPRPPRGERAREGQRMRPEARTTSDSPDRTPWRAKQRGWKRFRGIEREGGNREGARQRGSSRERLESAWSEWLGHSGSRPGRS